jgi:23S rRNA pseudouridine955/2504/2580 synthase/23S rRNA pseudouridine1911/1915/1917 synthase
MAKPLVDIVFEDDNLVAVNKPSGMLTLPDRHDGELASLRGILQKIYGEIFVVHRLDKDTSRLIVFAKNAGTHRYLSQLFENREVEKWYLGLVIGTPTPANGIINEPIAEHSSKPGAMLINKRGKESSTGYETLQSFGIYSLVKYQLYTGRMHQIRVHSKFMGHPIVCDPIYGDGKPVLLSSIKKKYNLAKAEVEERPMLARLALHAFQLTFKDETGKALNLEAPLHKDMAALIKQLEKKG